METPFSPSELIYLFLDGEHSGVERSVMFKAMAEDEDLQHEFEDALKIRNAATREANEVVPSAALGQSLMSRAGFSTLATGAVAAGATASQWFSGLFSHWSNIALLCFLPILGLGGGYYFANSSNSQTPATTLAATQDRSTNADNMHAQNGSTARIGSAQMSQQEIALGAQVQEERSTIALLQQRVTQTQDLLNQVIHSRNSLLSANQLASHRSSSPSYSSNTGANEATISKQGVPSMQLAAASGNNTIPGNVVLSQSVEQGTNAVTTVPMQATSVQDNQARNAIASGGSSSIQVDRYQLPNMSLSLSSISEVPALSQDKSPWKAELRGMQAIRQTMDSVVNRADARSVANLSASVAYQYSDSWSFFMSGGRENFVTLVYSNGSGGFGLPTPNQNLFWGTVGARWNSLEFSESLPIRAFLQVGLGASTVGAMGRGFGGVEWQYDSRVSFVGGVEQNVLRTTGNVTSYPTKTSFSYGLRLNF